MSTASLSFSLAWYTSAAQLHIETVEINIDADRELKLSTTTDLESFKEKLEYSDLEKVGRFSPVSSVFSSRFISLRADTPEFYDSAYSLVQEDGTPYEMVAHYGFYSQELYLYSDDDVYVTIDTEQTYIKANDAANILTANEIKSDYPMFTNEEIVERLGRLPMAMRFSILDADEDSYSYSIIDPHKEENEEVELGGILDNSKDGYYDSYMNSDGIYETIYGDINDRNLIVYDNAIEDETALPSDVEANAFVAAHELGVHPFNLEKSKQNGLKFATEQSYSLLDLEEKPNLIKIPVKRHDPKRIVLSIYIEGWDLESVNSTMGANFLAGITFKILREM